MTFNTSHARERNVYDKIKDFLEGAAARYRTIEHVAEGNSIAVAQVRGTSVNQGAKALVCDILGSHARVERVLAVISGIDRADMKQIGRCFGGKNASLTKTQTVFETIGCLPGTVPPFTLDHSLPLVVDDNFLESHSEIAFNAGRLDRSIILNSHDYVRLFHPLRVSISRALR